MEGRNPDDGAHVPAGPAAMSYPGIPAAHFAASLADPPTVSAAWDAFSLHLLDPPKHATIAVAEHVLALHVSGTGRLRREMGGRSRDGSLRVP